MKCFCSWTASASEFAEAVKKHVCANIMFGVKNGSHVWQPKDHYVSAAYKREMKDYYVEWLASRVPSRPFPWTSC